MLLVVASHTVSRTWETIPPQSWRDLETDKGLDMRFTSCVIAVECRVCVPTHYVI